MEDYSQNPETYYGNYGKILMKIKEIQPKAKIFVLTDPLQEVEAAGYNEAVRKISEMFSNVYLVDLYTYGSTLFIPDGLHSKEEAAIIMRWVTMRVP